MKCTAPSPLVRSKDKFWEPVLQVDTPKKPYLRMTRVCGGVRHFFKSKDM